MFSRAALALLALAALAAAAPAPSVAARDTDHTTTDIAFDASILAALEASFRDAAAASGVSALASSTTRNDVNSGLCADVILIWARGTYGAGNIGAGVGTAFVDALAANEPGRTIVQGVQPYPALVVGYLAGGSPEGARAMAALTAKAAAQCPGADIVWGGYSQGAQVAHLAAALVPGALHARIKAVVVFGDCRRS